MRILHVVDSGGIYGKEQVVLNLIKEQQKGHTVCLYVTGKPELVKAITSDDVTAIFYSSTFNLIGTILSTHPRFDIIHLHGYKESIVFSFLKFFGLIKPPLIKTVHGYTSKGKRWFSKIRLYEFLDRLTYFLHSAVVGVSPEMKTDLVIKNGIEDFAPNRDTLPEHFKKNRKDNNFIIGCAARLSEEKNVMGLVQALYTLSRNRAKLRTPAADGSPGIKIYIFGDGKEMEKLKGFVQSRYITPAKGRLDEVYLMGYVNNMRDYFGLFDVYVQPSLTEGTPIALLEAMATGQYAVTTYTGGMKYFIDKGVVDACGTEPEDIALSIVKGVAKNRSDLGHGQRARELFLSEYSSKVMSARYLELYNVVLSENI